MDSFDPELVRVGDGRRCNQDGSNRTRTVKACEFPLVNSEFRQKGGPGTSWALITLADACRTTLKTYPLRSTTGCFSFVVCVR